MQTSVVKRNTKIMILWAAMNTVLAEARWSEWSSAMHTFWYVCITIMLVSCAGMLFCDVLVARLNRKLAELDKDAR